MKINQRLARITLLLFTLILSPAAFASTEGGHGPMLDLTLTWVGIASIIIFVLAYLTVIGEEFLHLRKSKPVIVAAGVIWILIGYEYATHGDMVTAGQAIRHNILEYAELLLFLLSAMTFINTMEERQVFNALRAWLVTKGYSLKQLFWITGALAFVISPVADNLTTALLMAAVVMAVAPDNKTFVSLACINIVIGANAGGAFSPFGDITTLMVWQKGTVHFKEFFDLFVPSLVNWAVPAFLMSFAVPKEAPHPIKEAIHVRRGGFMVIALFLATIILTVTMHNYLNLPPMLGMMTGLGVVKFYGYYIRKKEINQHDAPQAILEEMGLSLEQAQEVERFYKPKQRPFDIFISMKRAEWDTLMFFYGVVLCVGGLGTIGYLTALSHHMYNVLGATEANILVGLLSAIVDNIPVMFAVLSMNPDMAVGQWLLVTLTAGVGGSLLSIGSAAGVALMGQARGVYTFFSHLRWSWAVGLGYALSIWAHHLLNHKIF